MEIRLLYFPGCPNILAARHALEKAMLETSTSLLDLREVNVQADDCPAHWKNWPSPSILVNGEDVEGQPPEGGVACRIYQTGRAPALEKIITAIEKAQEFENVHDRS